MVKIFIKEIHNCADCPNAKLFLNEISYSHCSMTGRKIYDLSKIESHCQLLDKEQVDVKYQKY